MGRDLDNCPSDRADGKTEILPAAVKAHQGAESATGPVLVLRMRAQRLQFVQSPDANDGGH